MLLLLRGLWFKHTNAHSHLLWYSQIVPTFSIMHTHTHTHKHSRKWWHSHAHNCSQLHTHNEEEQKRRERNDNEHARKVFRWRSPSQLIEHMYSWMHRNNTNMNRIFFSRPQKLKSQQDRIHTQDTRSVIARVIVAIVSYIDVLQPSVECI